LCATSSPNARGHRCISRTPDRMQQPEVERIHHPLPRKPASSASSIANRHVRSPCSACWARPEIRGQRQRPRRTPPNAPQASPDPPPRRAHGRFLHGRVLQARPAAPLRPTGAAVPPSPAQRVDRTTPYPRWRPQEVQSAQRHQSCSSPEAERWSGSHPSGRRGGTRRAPRARSRPDGSARVAIRRAPAADEQRAPEGLARGTLGSRAKRGRPRVGTHVLSVAEVPQRLELADDVRVAPEPDDANP
jgi:hypothetical protein